MMLPLLTLLTASSAVESSGDQRAVVRPVAPPALRQHEHRLENTPWAGWWCPDCA